MAETSDKEFQLEILTPEKKAFLGQVSYIKAPGADGYIGILVNHSALLSALQIGELEIITENKRQYFAISGGFLEVLNNHVSVLAETAEDAENIDVARAKAAKERAAEKIEFKKADTDFDRARLSLIRAINRLKISDKR